MNIEAIIATFLSAAAFLRKPIQDAAAQSVKDVFDTARYYLRKKFGEGSDGAKVLDLATEKPESVMRKAMLVEEAQAVSAGADPELVRLAEHLVALRPEFAEPIRQNVHVNGRANKVLVAGRDTVLAERVIQRGAIEPDERHVTPEQREKLRVVIGDLAARLARDDGRPNFAVGHRMLQRRYGVLSYALISRERFEDALGFLKQQRAIHRSRLRDRNPVAYQTDLFRAVFARARELGWDRTRVYRFAREKLRLKNPVTSLNELGSLQLKSLADAMQYQVRTARTAKARARDEDGASGE